MSFWFKDNKAKAPVYDQFQNLNIGVPTDGIAAGASKTLKAYVYVSSGNVRPIALQGFSMDASLRGNVQIHEIRLLYDPSVGHPDYYVEFIVKNTSSATVNGFVYAYVSAVVG